jgi:threonine dehydrogenase-like Zn-dependent dehydrogenase
VLERTGGRGADLVVENGGASTLARSIKAARRGGTVSCVGYLGGEKGESQLSEVVSLLIERRVTLRSASILSRSRFCCTSFSTPPSLPLAFSILPFLALMLDLECFPPSLIAKH